ncbi:uncharacterized protein LOC105013056 isoform X1 [Esox lucius]|uniref:uncharacterized protein LOC105013056 isoform X1 n=1 Tax=Esox lucius TaxID=8010 RepID=UPI0010BD012B|nr:uncharacterized protein LOC105013056 isoform X1 [Esox lucius]XP_028978996.1 uncharacterized protein LOC105013056 isoform X1 [Esox lucius]
MHRLCGSARPSTSRGRTMICPPAPAPTLMASKDRSEGSLTSQGSSTSPDDSLAFGAHPRSGQTVTRYRRVPSLVLWNNQSGNPQTRSAQSVSSGRFSELALARLHEETKQEEESLQRLSNELAVDSAPKKAKRSLFNRLKTYFNKKSQNKVDVLPSLESHTVDLPPAQNPWVTLKDGPRCTRLIRVLPCPAQDVDMERKGSRKICAQSGASRVSKQTLASIPEETLQELIDELSWDVEVQHARKSPWQRLQSSFQRKKSHTPDEVGDMTIECCFPYLHFLQLLLK